MMWMSWKDILQKFSHVIICEINEPTNFELANEKAPEPADFGKFETPAFDGEVESHIFPIQISNPYKFAFRIKINEASKDQIFGDTRVFAISEKMNGLEADYQYLSGQFLKNQETIEISFDFKENT